MFAIILFDKKENKIFFYCDPQGEKKLFYYNHDGNFIISSSIKPIINYLKKNDLYVSIDRKSVVKEKSIKQGGRGNMKKNNR